MNALQHKKDVLEDVFFFCRNSNSVAIFVAGGAGYSSFFGHSCIPIRARIAF